MRPPRYTIQVDEVPVVPRLESATPPTIAPLMTRGRADVAGDPWHLPIGELPRSFYIMP